MRFSAEYGWTAGPAHEHRHQVGTNDVRGEGLFLIRPGVGRQRLSRQEFLSPSVATCVDACDAAVTIPVDIPGRVQQYSGTIGGPIVKIGRSSL
jgi:hypothetical protein